MGKQGKGGHNLIFGSLLYYELDRVASLVAHQSLGVNVTARKNPHICDPPI